jgi:hypothetical protein
MITNPTPTLTPKSEILINNIPIIGYMSNPYRVVTTTGQIYSLAKLASDKDIRKEIKCSGSGALQQKKSITKKHLESPFFSIQYLNKFHNPFRGRKHTEEYKQKRSEERKGKWGVGNKNHMYGKKWKDVIINKHGVEEGTKIIERRSAVNKLRVGPLNHFFGKHHTEETRLHLSRVSSNKFNVSFYVEKGMTLEEATQKVEKIRESNKGKCSVKWFKEKYGENWKLHHKLYCESRKQTEEKFKKIYGSEEGVKKYKEYRDKTRNSLKKNNNRGWSKISQKLFQNIYEHFKDQNLCMFFATLHGNTIKHEGNKEYIVEYVDTNNKKRWYRLDFFIKDLSLVIEYNCKKWHKDLDADMKRREHIKHLLPGTQIIDIDHEDYVVSNKRDIILKQIKELIQNEINTHNQKRKN